MRSPYSPSNPSQRHNYFSRGTGPSQDDEDLRVIAKRLNDIIERSNQIDFQLSRIEETRKKTPPSRKEIQDDYISPIQTSISPAANASSESISNPSPNFSHLSNANENIIYEQPNRMPVNKNRPSQSSITSTQPRMSSYSLDSPPNPSPIRHNVVRTPGVTLEMIFSAISDLKNEVQEISACQMEMKREITRLRQLLE